MAAFRRLRADAVRRLPALARVRLVIRADAGSAGRAFAYCTVERPPIIAVSPRLEYQPDGRIDGVLMHEFGHAADIALGSIDASGAEARADALALELFDAGVFYDAHDVQTIDEGVPRPSYLPR